MKDESEFKYQVQMTEKQMQVVMEALEMFSRHQAGQFDHSFFGPTFESMLWKKNLTTHEVLDLLAPIKHKIFPELQSNDSKYVHASMGIYNPKLAEEARIAYSMYDKMRSVRNNKPSSWSNKPAENYSDKHPSINIKTLGKGNP